MTLQIKDAIEKIAEILQKAHGVFISDCGSDFEERYCSTCGGFCECQKGSRLVSLTRELMEIIEEEQRC